MSNVETICKNPHHSSTGSICSCKKYVPLDDFLKLEKWLQETESHRDKQQKVLNHLQGLANEERIERVYTYENNGVSGWKSRLARDIHMVLSSVVKSQ